MVWQRRIESVLTYDFCPWANRWLYWMKRPAAVLGLAAGTALACAVFVSPTALVPLAAMVAVLGLGYCWPAIAIRGVSATIHLPCRRSTEGQTVRARVVVCNRWPWPVWGLSLRGNFGGPTSVSLASMAGRSTAEFAWEFTPLQRGEFPSHPPRMETGFPFGLNLAGRDAAIHQTLLVWPRLIPLETLLDAAETRPSDDVFSEQRCGDSGDMTGTRPFRAGDSLRRVHWAQTARTGQLIVCERQAPAQSAIRVVFDSDPALHRGTGPNSTLEWSIRIAASVCAAYHRENAQVECCFGHESLVAAAGTPGWQKFLDALARWQPCSAAHGPHCGHEHPPHVCQRIHHHNCGVFQLTVTTDLGLTHRTEHRHVHGDQRMVVLQTSAFGDPCEVCGHEHQAPGRHTILLTQRDHVAEDFRRKWKQVCHAG